MSLEKMGEGKEESVRNLLHLAAGSVKQTPSPRSWGGICRSQQSHSLGKATGSGGRSPLPGALCHHWQTCRFGFFSRVIAELTASVFSTAAQARSDPNHSLV